MSYSSIKVAKIILIFLTFAIVFVGLIPVKAKGISEKTLIMSLLNTFAAGVFLAMAFTHIMPEAVYYYNEAMSPIEEDHSEEHEGDHDELSEDSEHKHNELFPLPYLLFLVGYLLILFVDKIATFHFGNHHSHDIEVNQDEGNLVNID